MSNEHVVIATDEGFAQVIDFGDDRWGFAIYRYAKECSTLTFDGGELVARGFADTEGNARVCADALAHAYICSDCCQQREGVTRGAKRANH